MRLDPHADLQGREPELLTAMGIAWAASARVHIRCPFPDHEDKHPSWRWEGDHRRWYCSCGRRIDGSDKAGGDIFDAIVRMQYASDFAGAVRWARERLGLAQPGATAAPKKAAPEKTAAPYQRAKKKPSAAQLVHPKWGKPSEIYVYQDPETREIAEVRARYEGPVLQAAGLSKEVIPWTLGADKWERRQMPGPRPFLAALEVQARDDAPILVVEGEGAKYRRARELFPDCVVTSASGGARAFAGMDYSLMSGRRVIVWPDNDSPGRIYAEGIARASLEAGASEARIVDVPREWPDAWDLGEEPPSDSVDLREMLDDAKPWKPTPAQNGALLNGHANGADHGPLLNGHASAAVAAPQTAGQAKAPKFKLTRFRNIKPVLSGMWLIKGLLPSRGLCTVFGEPGCGKSFLTLNFALHVASGRDYAGRRTKQGRVVYIAAEGQGGFRNRTIEAAKALGLGDDLQFDLIETAPNLGVKNGDAAALIEEIEAQGEPGDAPVVMIVVDTTSQTMGGENENLEGMATFIVNVNAVAGHFGCLAVAVHHVGKADTQTPRGWSGLHGANDTEIKVTGLENPHGAQVVKQKDGETGLSFAFNLNAVDIGIDEEDGTIIRTCVVEMTGDAAPSVATAKADAKKQPSRSIREFEASFNEAMIAASEEYRIDNDGPIVQAVYVHQIRPYFARRWATDEQDKRKRAKRISDAFKGVLKSLPPKYHTRDEMNGERIWRVS